MESTPPLSVLVGVLSLLAPAGVLVTLLLDRIFAREVSVTGRYDPTKQRYLFAFANNEEVAIKDTITITVRPLLPVPDSQLHAILVTGPGQDSAKREFVGGSWHCPKEWMRPLATWVVAVSCEPQAGKEPGTEGDLTFEVAIGSRRWTTLGRRPARQGSRAGPGMRLLATAVSVLTFLGEKAAPWNKDVPLREIELNQVDWVFIATLLLVGLMTIIASKPRPLPPVFGYMGFPELSPTGIDSNAAKPVSPPQQESQR